MDGGFAVPSPVGRGARRLGSLSGARTRTVIWCWAMLMPQIILFFVFTLYPVIMSFVFSFHDWPGFGPLDTFVGWRNYAEALSDRLFWNAVKNTLRFTAGLLVIQLPLALLIAVVINAKGLKGRLAYRAGFYLPSATTAAVVGAAMASFFATYKGVVNEALLAIGLINRPIEWLSSIKYSMGVVIAVGVWRTLGIKMVYWLAGLSSVPEELYDAAKVDGAGWWQALRHVTLPLVAKVGVVIVMISTRGALHVFDLVQAMTQGGPVYSTETVELYVYRYAFSAQSGLTRMGYASAVSVLFSLAVMVFGFLAVAIQRRANR